MKEKQHQEIKKIENDKTSWKGKNLKTQMKGKLTQI